MNKNTMAWIVIIAGAVGYFIPQWQGIFFDSSDITLGEGRIIGTIMFMGGLILLYLPEKIKS